MVERGCMTVNAGCGSVNDMLKTEYGQYLSRSIEE